MNRVLSLTLIVVLSFSALSCSPAPSDDDVTKAAVTVFAVIGMTVMASAFGMTPEDVEVDADMNTGVAELIFDQFDVPGFFEKLSRDSEAADVEIDFNFTTMTGTITMDGNDGLAADLELGGGTIDSLEIEAKGDEITKLIANGKDYGHIREIFASMQEGGG